VMPKVRRPEGASGPFEVEFITIARSQSTMLLEIGSSWSSRGRLRSLAGLHGGEVGVEYGIAHLCIRLCNCSQLQVLFDAAQSARGKSRLG